MEDHNTELTPGGESEKVSLSNVCLDWGLDKEQELSLEEERSDERQVSQRKQYVQKPYSRVERGMLKT